MTEIGLRLPDETYGYEIADVVEIASLAEACGYHSVWMAELQGHNGYMVLGQIAAGTSEIGLGTGIVNVFSRTPALHAMSVVTLDRLSEGRTLLGLAASSKATVEQWHGVDFERPLRRVRESIEIVQAALQDERVSYDGALFSVDDYPPSYDPVRTSVPIYNAALGPTNRQLTGEYADGWLPIHVPRSEFAEYIAEIEEAAEGVGREPDDITVAPYVVACVDADRERARDHVRSLLSFYLGAIDYYGGVFRRLGFEDEVDAIAEAWAAGDRETAADEVSDELLDEIAIAGTPEEGRARLREYRELGVDVPVIYPPPGPTELIEQTVRELASY
jgi:probable F420-dependent oxidoreductase